MLLNDIRIRNNSRDFEKARSSDALNGALEGYTTPVPPTTILNATFSQPFCNISSIHSPYQPHSRYQIRLFTTSKNDNISNEKGAETNKDPESKDAAIHNPTQIQELMENTVESVRPIVESAEANLKKAADVVRLGDLASVYGIVFLVFLIMTLPFVAR